MVDNNMVDNKAAAPLSGVRVLELAAIGPVSHAMMIMADLGADVVRVARPAGRSGPFADRVDTTLRGRRQLVADLKTEQGRQAVLDLVPHADVMVEGYRPGVCEKLGLGPDVCRYLNPGLVYARMTGWGQDGPFAHRAGHDINYISVTGALHAIGRAGGPPVPPLNLVGDFGGGSMFLVTGVLAALLERARSGVGQVLDVAMLDGVAALQQPVVSMVEAGIWSAERGTNLIDGGAPFYDVYECRDGQCVAVGALEPQFYAELLRGLGLPVGDLPEQMDRSGWPELRRRIGDAFRTRTRDEWAAHFEGTDACVTPVLSFTEAARHPQVTARRALLPAGAAVQAAPAPRFGSGHPQPVAPPPLREVKSEEVVASWRPRS